MKRLVQLNFDLVASTEVAMLVSGVFPTYLHFPDGCSSSVSSSSEEVEALVELDLDELARLLFFEECLVVFDGVLEGLLFFEDCFVVLDEVPGRLLDGLLIVFGVSILVDSM